MPLSTPDGGEINVRARTVSSELFGMLGASTPASGRAFLDEEYGGIEGPVMITYGEWQRRYGGDPGIVGQVVGRTRGGRFAATVVGVLPEGFRPMEAFFASGEEPGYYFPMAIDDPGTSLWYDDGSPLYIMRDGQRVQITLEERRRVDGFRPVFVIARLVRDTTVEEARHEVERLLADFVAESPEADDNPWLGAAGFFRAGLNGLQEQTVGASSDVFGLFMGAAGLLLALAIMNAATLLLARSLDRTREFGVRRALGAGWSRIARLPMLEAGLLAVLGGGLGVAIAYLGVGAFLRYAPASLPRLNAVAIDQRVLLVAAILAMGAGIAAGLVPSMRLVRSSAGQGGLGTGPTSSEPASRVRALLVAGQMTLAIVLLSGAGLLFNSFVRITTLDPGFEPAGLLTMTEPYKDSEFSRDLPLWQVWDQVLDAVRAVPGVESVAGTSSIPFQSPTTARLQLPGDTSDTPPHEIARYAVTPNYLQTVGTVVLEGRSFDDSDGPGSERVALVNESFVRTHLGGAKPIDARVRVNGEELRVIGVVQDVVQGRVEDGFRPALYVPYTQFNAMAGIVLMIRSPMPVESLVPGLAQVSAWVSPSAPPMIVSMPDRMASTRTSPRFQTLMITAFALVATLLAAAGLYGSMAHEVCRRERELSIRVALGAGRGEVVGMVLGQGLRLAGSGLLAGIVVTLLFARALGAFLYETAPTDPATLLTVAAGLLFVSMVACLLPAIRAMTVEPARILRTD